MKEPLKSFNIDFNWNNGCVANPEVFTKASVKETIEWYKEMHVNNFWTFATTYNGYAWYDSKIAPKAIGLNGDFMSETIELGHKEGMDVFAYVCLGDNPYLIGKDTKIARVDEDMFRMPFTDWYIEYFCSVCQEAIETAPMDGIVIDWFRYPRNKRSVWIQDEKDLFLQKMGEKLPVNSEIPNMELFEFEKRCIEDAWKKVYKTIKSSGDIKIWTNQPFDFIDDPIWNDNVLMKEVDYLLNECPDFSHLEWLDSVSGDQTLVVQNLCGWPGHELDKLNEINKDKFGFFGFAQADEQTCKPTERASPVNQKNIEIIRDFYKTL